MSTIEYELRDKDLVAFNQHQLHQSPEGRRTVRKQHYGMPIFLAFAGLFFWIFSGEKYAGMFLIAMALFWLLTVPRILRWDFKRKVMKNYSDEEKSRLFGTYRLSAEPQALHEDAPAGHSEIPWGEVLRVELDKHYAFVFVDVDSALIIPRETVSSGDLHQFVEKVDEYIEKAEAAEKRASRKARR